MKKKLIEIYFKTLEMEKRMFENTYLWGKGKELRQEKLKLKLIESRLNKI
jgi:hypothetical protein